MIMIIIDEFQQFKLFVFELFFYMIGDMLVKFIVKFVISLTSILKRSANYLKKNLYFYKILGFYLGQGDGASFGREFFFFFF